MQRLRAKGSSILGKTIAVPRLKKKALNSWTAVQDTFYSTKDIFERHRVVFTVSTSIASVATAWAGTCCFLVSTLAVQQNIQFFNASISWAGYTLRRHHESKVETRLDSIEKAMTSKYHIESKEFKDLVGSGNTKIAATIATAGTTLVIGYALGWRGGLWYANRKFRKEQMKLLGQIKPKRWQLRFFRRPLLRSKLRESVKSSDALKRDASFAHSSSKSITTDTKP